MPSLLQVVIDDQMRVLDQPFAVMGFVLNDLRQVNCFSRCSSSRRLVPVAARSRLAD
jgi:hypothetical protein